MPQLCTVLLHVNRNVSPLSIYQLKQILISGVNRVEVYSLIKILHCHLWLVTKQNVMSIIKIFTTHLVLRKKWFNGTTAKIPLTFKSLNCKMGKNGPYFISISIDGVVYENNELIYFIYTVISFCCFICTLLIAWLLMIGFSSSVYTSFTFFWSEKNVCLTNYGHFSFL